MTPNKFTIRGAYGILAGLNRHELSIDLDALIPSDAVTIALRGDNGKGKSTILNLALSPFREPPQLPGTLYDEFGPEGLRELEFTHGEQRYRSRIEIKQTEKTKGQKCFLHVHTDDAGWVPVALPDHTASDGKTRTYDACLEYVVGPSSLYYLSAFRAQNAPKLAEYNDPKSMMGDLLALSEPESHRETAKAVAKELRREYNTVRDEYERVTAKETLLTETVATSDRLTAELPALLNSKTDAFEKLALVKGEYEKITAENAGTAKLKLQRQELEARITEAEKQGRVSVQKAETDLNQSKQRNQQYKIDAARDQTTINSDLERVRARISSAKAMLNDRENIERAVAQVDALRTQLEEEEQSLSSKQDQVDQFNNLQTQARLLVAERKHCGDRGTSCKAIQDDLEKRASFIEQVPCSGSYPDCPALVDAIAAKNGIETATEKTTKERDEWEAIDDQIQSLLKEAEPISGAPEELEAAKLIVVDLKAQLASQNAIASKEAALEQVNKTLLDGQVEEVELISRQTEASVNELNRLNELNIDIDRLTVALAETITVTETLQKQLQVDLDAMPLPDVEGALMLARRELNDAESTHNTASQAVETQNANIAEHTAAADRLRREIDASKSIKKHAEHLEAEVSKWQFLAKALQGVIDLSIEDAGPAIATTANNLLNEAYGPRFSVRIITQKELANGNLVECFDISVIDAESGLESSILQKSGGESVWLDKALTDAVGIYHQDAAGEHYECLFADEAEDGLTQERKLQFYKMDRATLSLGGYKRKISISHDSEAWDMADFIIDLADYVE